MTQENVFTRHFHVNEATYGFLQKHRLGSIADEIRLSRDQVKGYSTTLKRAKIIKAVSDAGLLTEFCDEIWPSGNTERGRRLIRQFYLDNVYAAFKSQGEHREEEEEEDADNVDEVESIEERQFATEKALHDYLVAHLTKLEPGLKLYTGKDGITGNEFQVDSKDRRVDILAIDKNGTAVIIELKVSKGHERVVGQVLYYEAMVKKILQVDRTRIIVVANEISDELRFASETLKNLELFQYQISMEVSRVR